jgi:peptidoglycan/LPS O-acetylase OafA/YrhL
VFDLMGKRNESLDTLRACAILLVILAHTVLSFGAPSGLAPLQFGGTGVDLFFVLSGWLLGGQLFKEYSRFGNIEIRRFWLRRWIRTIPLYYVVLVLSVGQRVATKDVVDFPWQYFLFVQNYYYPLEFFSISWSLCVEEQFYLVIAPFVAISLFLSKKTLTLSLSTLLILPFFFRFFGWFDYPEETHVRWDGCIVGVILAQIKYQYQDIWEVMLRHAKKCAVICLGLYIMQFIARYNPEWGLNDFDNLFLAIIFGSWVTYASTGKYSADKYLFFPGANHIATRSYSMYLLHPEILAGLRRFGEGISFPLYFIITLIGTLVISECLYRWVEKPIMDKRGDYKLSKSRLNV